MKKSVLVKFLHNCGPDVAGEVKPIDARRAKRLEQIGYVELVADATDDVTEDATTSADEQAARPRTAAPRPRAERRG